jgi:hypothetical protein
MNKLKLIIVQRVFANYRKPIFDILSNLYTLKVLHSRNNSGIFQVRTDYSTIVKSFKYWNKETSIWLFIIIPLLKIKPDVIIHEFNPSILSLHLSFVYSRIFNAKFIIWGHGYSAQKGFNPNKSIVAKVRLWYLKHADAVILYSNERKSVLSKFVSKDKIFIAQNTLDTNKLSEIKEEFDKLGKEFIKKELGIVQKYNLVFIGRLLKDKFPNMLIQLYESFDNEIRNDIAIHIIGNGESYLDLEMEIKDKQFENSIFLHGKIDDLIQSGKFLYIADLLVNPGYLGLSINHAFCFSTPVISFEEGTNGPYHSPEIEYLSSGKTGYLAKNMDLIDMKNFIVNYFRDLNLQRSMIREIELCVKNNCSIEKMIAGFNEAIKFALKN